MDLREILLLGMSLLALSCTSNKEVISEGFSRDSRAVYSDLMRSITITPDTNRVRGSILILQLGKHYGNMPFLKDSLSPYIPILNFSHTPVDQFENIIYIGRD